MSRVYLAVMLAFVAALSIATIFTPMVLAQNMSGGTPEKTKFPGNETFAGNATNTTITQGVSPNSTTPTGSQ
jgi:hypothetical protein